MTSSPSRLSPSSLSRSSDGPSLLALRRPGDPRALSPLWPEAASFDHRARLRLLPPARTRRSRRGVAAGLASVRAAASRSKSASRSISTTRTIGAATAGHLTLHAIAAPAAGGSSEPRVEQRHAAAIAGGRGRARRPVREPCRVAAAPHRAHVPSRRPGGVGGASDAPVRDAAILLDAMAAFVSAAETGRTPSLPLISARKRRLAASWFHREVQRYLLRSSPPPSCWAFGSSNSAARGGGSDRGDARPQWLATRPNQCRGARAGARGCMTDPWQVVGAPGVIRPPACETADGPGDLPGARPSVTRGLPYECALVRAGPTPAWPAHHGLLSVPDAARWYDPNRGH